MDDFPKLLIVLGISIALVGAIWWVASRFFDGAQLPGTLVFQSGGMTCIIPILGSILLSIILTVVLNLLLKAGK
ncbi:MAG: DUF2905 domain-containing protein [Anaerolineae bacterium]|nr:DUF2905 domain-containing protein [Anaerolineae bacterium]